jgi:hypothetical protein
MDLALSNLDQLLKLVNDTNTVGLRLRVDQIASSTTLLQRLGDRPHWLIWEHVTFAKCSDGN